MKKMTIIVLMAVLCAMIVCACTPKEDEFQNKFNDGGFTVTKYTAEAYKEAFGDLLDEKKFEGDIVNPNKMELDYVLRINNNSGNQRATVIVFKKAGDATEFYNSLESRTQTNFAAVKKGNAVIFGNSEIVAVI